MLSSTKGRHVAVDPHAPTFFTVRLFAILAGLNIAIAVIQLIAHSDASTAVWSALTFGGFAAAMLTGHVVGERMVKFRIARLRRELDIPEEWS